MSDCAAATVGDRIPLRSHPPEEESGDFSAVEGAEEMRLVFPSPADAARVSADRGSARVLGGEAGDYEGGRSDEEVGTRVRGGGGLRGLDAEVEGHRAPEAEAVERTVASDAGVGKDEYGSGYFSSDRSVVETGACDDGSEEFVGAKQESGQTMVPSWYSSRSEVSEARGWMHGFEAGDMVWGKVKSHPWWPGHIFNEAFASSSVRRTKREGHVLVAFFGDSSYGWFDPAELIPFDPHYAEKSRQTTSRNFTKSVEEAVDEASRRSALALSCCCRNPSNFRPTAVPGYFAVDVAGYEPGGVYSSKQIQKSRDNFVAANLLSFVGRLAMTPKYPEQGSIDWIMKMATLLSLRKAMFEEFDVTYAEAFGVQPVLPSRAPQRTLDQPERVPSRAAPLSGPLVIAEALGERRGSSKAVVRAKDASAKKNKYLFKRREEAQPASSSLTKSSSPPGVAGIKHRLPSLPPSSTPGYDPATPSGALPSQVEAPNVHYHLPHGQADIIVAAAGGSYAAEVGNYVLQKRVPEKQQQTNEGTGRAAHVHDGELGALSPQKSPDGAAEPTGRSRPHPHVKGVGRTEQPAAEGDEGSATVKVVDSGDVGKNSHHEYNKADVDDAKKEGMKAPAIIRIPQPAAALGKGVEHTGFAGIVSHGAPSPVDADAHQRRKLHQKTKPVGDGAPKQKALKHPRDDHPGEELGVKKRRKQKEGHPPLKHPKDGESLGTPDNSQAGAVTRFDGSYNSCTPPDSAAAVQQLPKPDWASHNLDLPSVLGDLSALALDPFYGAERNAAAAVRHLLLRFRSLVYEKALPFPSSAELDDDTSQPHSGKFRAGRPLQEEARKDNAGMAGEGEAREQRESTNKGPRKIAAVRSISKPNDLTKLGRKRMPSDRQEEKAAKRLRNLEKWKALTSVDKKAANGSKAPDAQPRGGGGEHKDAAGATAVAPVKTVKSDSFVKKPQDTPAPPKVAIPTYLLMRFPQRTTLPSISSLKARFARFGPLDLTGTRVFWKSYTCRVLFKHKPDAQAACNYAQSNDMFGQVKVYYSVRELESPVVPDPPSSPVKRIADDSPLFRPPPGDLMIEPRPPSVAKHQSQPSSSSQLKSILKKASGEEAAPAGAGVVKEAQRVKFMLGGGEDGRGETGGGGILSPPGPLDANRKVPKSVAFLPPLQPPLLLPPHPLPPPRAVGPSHDVPAHRGGLQQLSNPMPLPLPARYGDMERSGVDISRQMLSLLARCSDIVTNVKSALGYVPYHPL
uniref:DNA mismatch repair protein Msh6 n=1 Tax=Anthurium amnicola TaxID=1678845 RepID=A0A1D1Y0I8_9ARAE